MVASPPPKGVWVPVPTFFASKDSPSYDPINPPIDVETQAKHAIHLAKSGIKGIVLLGSTGEAVHIAPSERHEMISHVRKELEKAGFKDYPLMVGTATQSIEETVQSLKEMKESGSQWGLCLAPGYFASAASQEGIKAWFKNIADQSPLPVLIYNYPAVSNGLLITADTMEALAKHPNIVGCKLSHGNMDDHALIASSPDIDHTKFQVFTGLGQQLLPLLLVGGAGAIDGLSSIFPKTVVHLFNSYMGMFEGGDVKMSLAAMRDLQVKVCKGEKLVVKWGTIGVKEGCARVLGMGDADGCRMPLNGGFPGGDKEWENWKPVMDDLQKFEDSL
ncbi:aldolase [Aulographum hederae CBS 113979]|uniref:Aldolase n=1 Tax=Aulographum hederae CBS 113979 TaxID=1176131 RepID=A0A6G1H5Q7_9PEZI|nr:aldolase [Aulographum hederae CBS 113979]